MLAQCFGVSANTVYEVRALATLKANPKYVESWLRRHTTLMPNLAATVEHGDLQPGIAAFVTGRPNDCPDVFCS
jgi:hypothetical protein